MKYKYLILLLCVVGIGLLLKAQNPYHTMLNTLYEGTVDTKNIDEIDPGSQDIIILDTRSREEYEVSHIPGAVWVDYDHFTDKDLLRFSKEKTIITYCTVGYRSEKVGEKLQNLGFGHVFNLYGGIFEWVNEGNEVVNMNNQPTKRVHTYDKTWSIWLEKGEKVYD